MSDDNVVIEFSKDEALILFDWLSRCNESEVYDFKDQAELRVLWNLECMFEKKLVEPFMREFGQLVDAARNRVRDKMD